jgi:acetoin utilization deacetylase AcuC-like enzyme
MNIIYSDKFLLHDMGPGHPESPERLRAIMDCLKDNMKFTTLKSLKINDEDLFIVHAPDYIRRLKLLSSSCARFPDNLFSSDTYRIAKLAAGGALRAAVECFSHFSFAIIRPPGHHAGRSSFGGFCYLNNIAFAVKSTQKKGKAKRAMIIDVDVHHGNGTYDIFKNDESVFYLSFHQDPNTLYPFTSGFEDENSNHVRNVLLAPGTEDDEYMKKFKSNVKECASEFKPDLIGVSIGFDTYKDDPIGGLSISDSHTYFKMGSIIRSLRLPAFAVLEGGYCIGKLGENACEFSKAFLP